MGVEGMGRRRPQQDVEKEILQGEEDFVFEQHQRKAMALIELARPIDERDKVLTGRKMENYVEESGVMQAELFPENGSILNIGDPWQTLDRKGIVTLEYETGDEASFISDELFFFATLEQKYRSIEYEIGHIQSVKSEVAKSLQWKLNALREFQKIGLSVSDYPKQAQVAHEIAKELGQLVPDIYDRYPNAWYAAVHIARGFSDIHLNETVIKPKIDQEVIARKGLSEMEAQELRRQLINEHRGQKKYRESELVKGAFPHTDFADDSFDRITASWSISAHMFGVMDSRHFSTTWEEIDRLLHKDGAAYFWPMNIDFDDPDQFIDSVQKYIQSGGQVGFIMSGDWGHKNAVLWCNQDNASTIASNWNNIQTLVVLSRRHGLDTIKRIESSLVSEEVFDEFENEGYAA